MAKNNQWGGEELVGCVGGHLSGLWFTREDWDIRVRSHERMRALGSRSFGALDYVESGTVAHPSIGCDGARMIPKRGR